MSTFDLLTSYRPALPSDDELDLVTHVIGFVAAIGVDLPRFTVEWYEAEDGLPDGITTPACPVLVQFRVGQHPCQLVRTALHELWHVHETRDVSLFVQAEREPHAEAFAETWHVRACRALGIHGAIHEKGDHDAEASLRGDR